MSAAIVLVEFAFFGFFIYAVGVTDAEEAERQRLREDFEN